MLDIQLFRNEPERVAAGLAAKKADPAAVEAVRALDQRRRDKTFRVEQLKKERNDASKQVGMLLKSQSKAGTSAGGAAQDKASMGAAQDKASMGMAQDKASIGAAAADADALKARVREIGEETAALDATLALIEEELYAILLRLPNLPHASTPAGASEEDNVTLRSEGAKPAYDFAPKAHWDLGAALGILDLERGARISGSGFFILKGLGARLQRALISYMIDMHVALHGYTEMRVPYVVNRATMTGTGQLPKMEDDMYRIESEDLFLIPTAEVPVTNYHAGEILDAGDLPRAYVCYTPCFRREAGAAGKENRGMTRVHQFDKVEMVRTVLPETSYDQIEILLGHAEEVLRSLGLHYRILSLCAGDISFAAAKCYDIEVWAPGMDRFLEVSSCSNFEDFQARRAGIRFRREKGAKPEFVHTLNASGVALPRLMIALLETYQQADGSVVVPEPLRAYMGGCEVIRTKE